MQKEISHLKRRNKKIFSDISEKNINADVKNICNNMGSAFSSNMQKLCYDNKIVVDLKCEDKKR